MTDALNQYQEECKKNEGDFRKFSLHVHGYLLPLLQKELDSGSLKEVDKRKYILPDLV